MLYRTLLALLLVLIVSGESVAAQDPQAVHAAIYCMKANPGKAPDFERLVLETALNVAQVRIQAGQISGWFFARAVAPSGSDARCDYLGVTTTSGPPPAPADTLAADLAKAGLKMTAPELRARLDSLSSVVSHERAWCYASFGEIAKGDYFQLNFMKPLPGKAAEFMQFEQKVYMPLGAEAAKGGHPRKAWSAWRIHYPSGTGLPWDDFTVDVFRDWASIWKPQAFPAEVAAKVFPGKTIQELFQPSPTLRNLVRRELYVLVERTSAR
jgi:hypothetical protein